MTTNLITEAGHHPLDHPGVPFPLVACLTDRLIARTELRVATRQAARVDVWVAFCLSRFFFGASIAHSSMNHRPHPCEPLPCGAAKRLRSTSRHWATSHQLPVEFRGWQQIST